MKNGEIILGKYHIEPNTSMNVLKTDEFNIVNVKCDKILISKNPIEFYDSLFWVNIYTKDSVIVKIELSNANEKYKMNYQTMDNILVENLRKDNDMFLLKLLGNPSITSVAGVQYNYSWGKIFTYFDNKSAEAGIVIDYI